MRRCICVLITLSFLLLWGCSAPTVNDGISHTFYYCSDTPHESSDNSLIYPESRMISPDQDNTETIVDLYLRGPQDDDLLSPFPYDVSVVDLSQVNQTAYIILSRQFGRLSGIDLTVACSCLSMTLAQLLDVKTVVIAADNLLLDGKQTLTIKVSDISTRDTAADSIHDQ